jgi:PAS domain S-box-containing protein
MRFLEQNSVRRKLIAVIMLTVGPALLLAVLAFLGIEVAEYRTAAKREIGLLAKVVGESSSAALEFKDPTEGRRLLANLRAHPHIVAAALLDRRGATLATYRRDGDGPAAEAEGRPGEGTAFEGGHLWVTTPVRHAGETLGTIYLQVEMSELNQRLMWVLAVGVALTLLIASFAMLLAMKMGRLVSEPILHLTAAARSIASGRDTSVRVPRETEDEVGLLVDTFNRMLDRLEEHQARLEEAQQMARLGNWVFDPGRQFSEWSDETFRIFGLDPAKGVPDDAAFRTLIHPEDMEAYESAMARGLGAEGRFELDHRILRPDGSIGWIHALGVKHEAGGRPILRGTLMDITDRKHSEAALLQGQKLESLGVLAGGIAHDFNNLLAALQGFIEMARLEAGRDQALLAPLDKAERVIRRAADLVRQMLAYSGKASFQLTHLDLSASVREMGHLLSASISKRAKIRYELDESLPAMLGDPAQIQQVVMNLVINASDALPSKGGFIGIRTSLVTLSAEDLERQYPGQDMEPGPYLALEVEDNGHGMDEATQARIFDPFFTTKFTGRGLGLAAMLGIVRAHKGGIQVTSEVGKGTHFKVLFPAGPERRVEAVVPEPLTDLRGEGAVLVVDDEADVRTSACAMLQWMGFEPDQAKDGREALERVGGDPQRYRMVLLDLTMPVMDGEICFHALRELAAEIPILLTSGFSESTSLGLLQRGGPTAFLQKPYNLQQLQAALRRVIPC